MGNTGSDFVEHFSFLGQDMTETDGISQVLKCLLIFKGQCNYKVCLPEKK